MKLYFVTVNRAKVAELVEQVAGSGIDVEQHPFKIREVLDVDLETIVRDKTLSAYRDLGRPCVVEHGGLFIDALNGLPGGLTKEVWSALGERLCELLPADGTRTAVARSLLGHCDGRKITVHTGETRGSITLRPVGSGGFSWDPIFVPEGSEKTLAEMSPQEKAQHSPGIKAWNELRKSLAAH